MKIPTHCPQCKDPLLTSYFKSFKDPIEIKECSKRLDHNISFMIDYKDYSLISFRFSLKIRHSVDVTWDIQSNTISVLALSEDYTKTTNIPWFEPDFESFHKTIQKVKTYLVFI